MNHKQKLGYMALGAGILALGIIIGQWTTPPMEAQNNGVFDWITCRELDVVDKHGKTAISLYARDSFNGIDVYDKAENMVISLSAHEEDPVISDSIEIYNKTGEPAISLSTVKLAGNSIRVFDPAGKEAIGLHGTKILNIIGIQDKAENSIIDVFGSHGNSSISIRDVRIMDKADNTIWEAP